jgi:hypothetical protein
MPYARSRARKIFEDRVIELRSSAKLASIKKRKFPEELKDLVYHAAILQTSAAIEEYVKQVIEDYQHRLITDSKKIKDLPQLTRAFILFSSTKNIHSSYLATNDEKKAIDKIDLNSPMFHSLFHDQEISHNTGLKNLLNGKKYPSPDNWETLFYRFGIVKIFSKMDANIKKPSKWMLTSFNDIRNSLAHEEPPDLTLGDINLHLNNMLDFVRGADKVIHKHICKVSGNSTWVV